MEQRIRSEAGNATVKLSAVQLSDDHMQLLCQQDCSKVKQIFASFNLLTSEAFLSFPRANWHSLTHIHIWSNRIQDKGCKFISQTPLPSLHYLNIGPNQISNSGLSHLTKASWPTLQRVNLFGNQLSQESVKILLKAQWQAPFLDICLNQLSAEELEYLVLSEVPEVRGLVMNGALVEEERVAGKLRRKMEARFGKITIQVGKR